MDLAENENEFRACVRTLSAHAQASDAARNAERKALLALFRRLQANQAAWKRETKRLEARQATLEAALAAARDRVAAAERAEQAMLPVQIDLTSSDDDDVKQQLTDVRNRLAAAEQENKELHKALYAVEVISVETDHTEQIVREDVEPASKRLKRLQEDSSELQARAAKAQVRVKQEKAEVAEDLEVSN